MNINTLQVMNSLYNLGLTEEEFKGVADEISHKERTGFSIKAVKGTKIIGVAHDNKEDIVIQESSKLGRYDFKANTRILLKTLIQFDELPEQIYTLHKISRYHSRDWDIRNVANNLEELKAKICERFSDKYPKMLLAEISSYDYSYEERAKAEKERKGILTEQLKAIYWLFDEPFNFEFKTTSPNIATIIKVFSGKNIRVAIIQEFEKFRKRTGAFYSNRMEDVENLEIRVRSFKPNTNDRRYDYTCEGREIFCYDQRELWITDELKGKLSDKELTLLIKRVDTNCYQILTKQIYEAEQDSLRVEIMTAKRKAQEEKGRDKLVSAIKEKFSKGKIERQGVAITPDSVSFNGLTITGDKMKEYIEFANIPFRETLDFNSIAIGYIEYLLQRSKDWDYYGNDVQALDFTGEADLTIGKIKIHIKRVKGVMFVNDFRVRTDEVCKIIEKAIRFNTQEQYNAFLKDVSRESLRLKNALQNGISFSFEIKQDDDNCLIKNRGEFKFTLPLKKIENKVYVAFGENNYKVKDINSLFQLKESVDEYRIGNETLLGRAIKLLYKGIKDISPVEIGKLVVIAQKEHTERIGRSKKFIEHAVRIAQAERVSKGWVVTGESGMNYFVGDNLEVYKMKNGDKEQYLCVFDTQSFNGDDEAQANDGIAKRILAMRHDISVAKDMWELGDRVDSWWRDIQSKDIQEQIKRGIEGIQEVKI